MIELALFCSQFAIVMLLGLQSLNVNNGHHWAAFLTSFGIGGFHLVLYKALPDAGVSVAIAYLLGGPFGILAAMWLHPRMTRKPKKHTGLVPKPGAWPPAPKRQRDGNINCGADRP